MSGHTLNASGSLRALVDRHWASLGMRSKIAGVFLKGDGFVRVEWDDGSDSGSFHISMFDLYQRQHAALVAERDALRKALRTAIKVADEAREEWDKAPSGMKAGKLLIALSDPKLKYRADITEMHAALSPDASQREEAK